MIVAVAIKTNTNEIYVSRNSHSELLILYPDKFKNAEQGFFTSDCRFVEIVEESKTLATGELTASLANDSIAIETVLNIIKKQQAEIKDLQKSVDEIYEDYQDVGKKMFEYSEKLEKKDKLYHRALNDLVIADKIIDEMAKYIEEQTGSCPLDMFNYKKIDCENVCKHDMYNCWIEYFKRTMQEEN